MMPQTLSTGDRCHSQVGNNALHTNKEEGGMKKLEECLSVMPQTLSTGDRRHSQVGMINVSNSSGAHLNIYTCQ